MLKRIIKFVLSKLFSVRVIGLDNYHKAGEKVIIVANNLSWLDGILLAVFLPGNLSLVINKATAHKWYIKFASFVANIILSDYTNPANSDVIANTIKQNTKCIIFPEGRISITGSLMRVYEMAAIIADETKANVLPIRIDGTQYSYFSKLKSMVRIRFFPKITLTILPSQTLTIPSAINCNQRRHIAGLKLYDLMENMMYEGYPYHNKTLLQAILDQARIHGYFHAVMEDISRIPLTYNSFFNKVFVLGRKLTPALKDREHVGVMLPNVLNSVITFFAIQVRGSIPAMINFTMGSKNVLACCKAASVKTIVTSKKFIDASNLCPLIKVIEDNGIKILYLEDVASSINFFDKIAGLLHRFSYRESINPDDAAVILFTSGSEGTPKGVVLTHNNLQANCAQFFARIDFSPIDKVFNALPIFHTFGLTAGVFLPLTSGIRCFLYTSPLHYHVIPELVYETNSTIMFGTDTFFFGYAHYAHPYSFRSLRFAISGAEQLKEETRKLWLDKYGVRIFQGYGVTETSPALSTNTGMFHKPGTMGRLLPGMTYRLEKIPGIEVGGSLVVSGRNIMKGYLLVDKPGVLQPTQNNSHDTGDVVSVDEEGFLKFHSRVKRFAKIAGEMVSLTAVEVYIHALWPHNKHAVVSIQDSKRGDVLALVTDYDGANREEIFRYVRQEGISELWVPRIIKVVPQLPVLGTGKVDHPTAKSLVEA